MAKKSILLVGAGGHCKASIDVIEQIGEWQIAGIIDRQDSGVKTVLGYPVIGCDEDLPELRKQYDYALVTIGQIRLSEPRVRLFEQLKTLGYKQPGLVSPLAYVSQHAIIGAGTVVMHQALVNAGAQIGQNGIINSQALIEHDVVIGDDCHIATGAKINGDVKIGRGCFIGSGVVIKQGVELADNVMVGAGALILNNITRSGCYVNQGRLLETK
ncbi:acetyl transferase [Thiomicrospira aerophila AL3]|uniref:Acetyl transferase n=1 Tax=Thiomicrospira aerophila AL3 TaxID=717772 RepID=W0DXI8_9GAMM|nr:acetyltransferase [Thiomicrospira aerophila]AHF01596.1 acetyl transferase [Thiomicrospira aerophila AL3]